MTENELFGNSEQLNDLISRQAALGALGERPVVWSDNDDYTLGARNQYDMDRLALETVPSVQQWVPCSKRLPETSGQYYVSGGGKVWICEFLIIPGFIGGWCNDAANPVVQAWMPLPEKPWKGGREFNE